MGLTDNGTGNGNGNGSQHRTEDRRIAIESFLSAALILLELRQFSVRE